MYIAMVVTDNKQAVPILASFQGKVHVIVLLLLISTSKTLQRIPASVSLNNVHVPYPCGHNKNQGCSRNQYQCNRVFNIGCVYIIYITCAKVLHRFDVGLTQLTHHTRHLQHTIIIIIIVISQCSRTESVNSEYIYGAVVTRE